MNNLDSRQLELIVRLVVEEVLKATGEPLSTEQQSGPSALKGGDVLCIATPAEAGLEQAGRQLIELQKGGVQLGLLNAGSKVPPVFGRVQFSDEAPSHSSQINNLLKKYDHFLVLNLSRQMTAELATGATTSPSSELLYQALGKGRPVVAATDPLEPTRVGCPEDPVHLTAVQQIIQRQIPVLENLGMELLFSEEIFETVAEQVQLDRKADGMKPLSGFITLEDLEGFQGRRLRVAKDARLTPLVEEWLRDNKIKVHYVD
jgi:hypothetical protein